MKKNKIPTAEEFLDQNPIYWRNGSNGSGSNAEEVLIAFAKLHVKAALEAAVEKAAIKKTDLMPGAKRYVDKESILNAYPETNIK